MIMGGTFFHMCCCAHLLNLIVRNGLFVIQKEAEKIKDSVYYQTVTSPRIENFEVVKGKTNNYMLKKRRTWQLNIKLDEIPLI